MTVEHFVVSGLGLTRASGGVALVRTPPQALHVFDQLIELIDSTTLDWIGAGRGAAPTPVSCFWNSEEAM
ncbi:hypothetical protein GCM10011492_37980 [Flexivirga endophytica]|uniref:Uncharacterized protein n=1 Tax=Flexivirga endophytica TaxID=1849103 RepID=A0A916X060_9MICO|nr:hypothetical protein GCM10011492_37980 [Flexivirga endophytica]GHB68447.1 hypothetical protein GCM10008112_41530 [Flexivirga endophytica]